MNGHVTIAPTADALARIAGERILNWLGEDLALRGRASLVLSGGSTPRFVYEYLAAPQRRDRINWSKVQLFWGDERCVGPTMPDSNYRMAHEVFLKFIAIPEGNVHRIQGERIPQEAARRYEMEVKKILGPGGGQLPQFSLVLLGLGNDGHTASLLPDTTALGERLRLVTEVYTEKLRSSRVTMTLPLLNNARRVLFLVSGRTKAGIVRDVLEGNAPQYPAQLIAPRSGNLYWLLDEGAASQLQLRKEQ